MCADQMMGSCMAAASRPVNVSRPFLSARWGYSLTPVGPVTVMSYFPPGWNRPGVRTRKLPVPVREKPAALTDPKRMICARRREISTRQPWMSKSAWPVR